MLLWILFYLLSISAAYTHYYMTIGVCVLYVVLILFCFINRKDIKYCIAFSVLALISYLPWVPLFFSDAAARKDDWWVSEYSHFKDILGEIFGYVPLSLLACLVIGFLLVYKYLSLKRDIRIKGRESAASDFVFVLTGVLLLIIPSSVGIIASILIRPYIISRYIYPYAAVCWLLFGMGIQSLTDILAGLVKAESGKLLRVIIPGSVSIVISFFIIKAGWNEYLENVAYQVEASAKTNYLILSTPMPEGTIVYSEIEYEESNIVQSYFPQTIVFSENTRFYYREPEYDEFYLFWKDDHVDETVNNLNSYGYECTLLSSGGCLGVQENISVVFCKKN